MDIREPIPTDDLEVRIAEMLVSTTDQTDRLVDRAIPEVLQLLRQKMNMDVVFVSEFSEGRRHFRHVAQAAGKEVLAEGASDPLEESWCQRVVEGRLPQYIPDAARLQAQGELPQTPFPIGTHLSTPVVLPDGSVYGTLCCFSFGVHPHAAETDLRKLRYTADLAAQKIARQRG